MDVYMTIVVFAAHARDALELTKIQENSKQLEHHRKIKVNELLYVLFCRLNTWLLKY